MPHLYSSLLLSLLIASSASAVTMDWTYIGDPGNPADTLLNNDGTSGYGSVPYAYYIGTYEVTNAQYEEFLNAKATFDPLGLYNTTTSNGPFAGIERSGDPGAYSYTAIAGREDMPVNASFYNALRFANWMNNGQGDGDTETGSYLLLGGTPIPTNAATVARNAGASIVLTSENEWYKAAYYDAATTTYFVFPAGSNEKSNCSTPTATPNSLNGCQVVGDLTPVGSYPGSPSPFGTFDQGGNVREWNETIFPEARRGARGGDKGNDIDGFAAYGRYAGHNAFDEDSDYGFRVAMIPEPGTGLLVITGLLGLAGWRRTRA